MMRKILQYSSGLNIEFLGVRNTEAESAGGINIGLSALAFVSTILICGYAGIPASNFILWLAASAIFVVYFFVFRLIFGSSLSFVDSEDGKISFSALSRRIPHIIAVYLLTHFLASAIAIELSQKEINYQISVMQVDAAVKQGINATGADNTSAEKSKELSVLPVGYTTRMQIANQINPKGSAIISMLFVIIGLAPLFFRMRK